MKPILLVMLGTALSFADIATDTSGSELTLPIPLNCTVQMGYQQFTFSNRCWMRDEVMTGISFQPGMQGIYCSKMTVVCNRDEE